MKLVPTPRQLVFGVTVYASTLVLAPRAGSSPQEQSALDSEDDATVELTVHDMAIVDDERFWCVVEVEVLGVEVPLTAGDLVTTRVLERDGMSSDLLFEDIAQVSQEDVDAAAFVRLLDCGAPLPSDGEGEEWEIFAEVAVEKDQCGFLCVDDQPTTSNLLVAEVTDDAWEDDDDISTATAAKLDEFVERVSTDADWLEIELDNPGTITVELSFMEECGAIDGTLTTSDEVELGVLQPHEEGGTVVASELDAGTYFVRIEPSDDGDYGFYGYQASVAEDPAEESESGQETGDSGAESTDTAESDASTGDDSTESSSSSDEGDASEGGESTGGKVPGGGETEPGSDSAGCSCTATGGAGGAAWCTALLGWRRRRARTCPAQ